MKRSAEPLTEELASLKKITKLSKEALSSTDNNKESLKLILATIPRAVVEPACGRDVATLIDLLRKEIDVQVAQGIEEPKGFWHNRGIIIEAYKEGNLYVQHFTENDANWCNTKLWAKLKESPLVMAYTNRAIPSFCVVDEEGQIDLIWTEASIRHLGIARTFVQYFDTHKVRLVLPESQGFWEKCGVRIKSYAP